MAIPKGQPRERPPRVFFCYRRAGADRGLSSRLYEHLIKALGPGAIFRDVGSLQAGDRWTQRLVDEIRRCHVFLAVIGRDWLTPLLVEADVVRLEIACAFHARRFLVPVLLEGAPRLSAQEHQPRLLKDLASLHYQEVRNASIHEDTRALVHRIRELTRWDRRVRAAVERVVEDWEDGTWESDSESVDEFRRLSKVPPIADSLYRPWLEHLLRIAEVLASARREIARGHWYLAFLRLDGLRPQDLPRCAAVTRRTLLVGAKADMLLLDCESRYPESEVRHLRRELEALVSCLKIPIGRIPGAEAVRAHLETLQELFARACAKASEVWPLDELLTDVRFESTLVSQKRLDIYELTLEPSFEVYYSQGLDLRTEIPEVLRATSEKAAETLYGMIIGTDQPAKFRLAQRAPIVDRLPRTPVRQQHDSPTHFVDLLPALGIAASPTLQSTIQADPLLFRVHGSRTVAIGRPSRVGLFVYDRRALERWPPEETAALPECSVRLRFAGSQHQTGLKTLRWRDGIAEASFHLAPFHGDVGQTLAARWTVRLDGVAVARASFEFQLATSESEPTWLSCRVQRFRYSLGLFAARERERFARRLAVLRVASPRLSVATPSVFRAFDDAELSRTLERFDLVLLFWSTQTRRSELMRRICRLAVAARGLSFIEPVAAGGAGPSDRDVGRWLARITTEARRQRRDRFHTGN